MILPIVEQHADQASFIWGLRCRAVAAPHHTLADVAKLDLRVEAHIDGLRIAGEEGWELCAKEPAWEEASKVFAVAVLALESGDQSKIQHVLRAATKNLLLASCVSALGWLDYQRAEPYIKNFCASDSPGLRRICIAAAAVHRKDPGRPLDDAVIDPGLLLRARALRAVGELARMDLVPLIQQQLISEDDACRFWAAWSTSLLIGYADALQVLQSFAESDTPYRERAVQLALRRIDLSSAHSWQEQLAKNPQSARLAVIGAGVIGDPVLIPWLIEQMNLPPVARVAGEAFTMITSVDIAYEDLDSDKPEGFESGPTEDPKDEHVEMDPDERLPWPNPILIRKWWEKNCASFQAGVRHLLGKPISVEWMQQVLRIGRQRQRAAAALELAIMQPGTPLFEVRAPGFRQQEMLGLSRRR
jgi:uncharacterized protein (TIGR02270 family)